MCGRRGLRSAALPLGALLLVACAEPPPRRIDVGVRTEVVALSASAELVEVTYDWNIGPDYEPLEEPLTVFVHFLDSQGRIVAQDDHVPPRPSREWRPGETISYTRKVWIPDGVGGEQIVFFMGLYGPSGRVEVRREGRWSTGHSTPIATRAGAVSGIPRPRAGWHRMERSAGAEIFHWTDGEAVVVFDNPRQDASLLFEGESPLPLAGESQRVVLKVNGEVVADFAVTGPERFSHVVPLAAQTLGEDGVVELTIVTEPTVVPSEVDATSRDNRTLGVKVYFLYLSTGVR